MSARTAGRRRQVEPAEFDDPDLDPAADGLFVRLAARVVENPAMSGGLLVMVLTVTAVVSNAVFLQRSPHPEPWFATRPAVAVTPGGETVKVPDPRPRGAAPVAPMVEPPTPRVQPEPPAASSAAAVPAGPSAPAASPKLVADLQQALAARGLYEGKVDGIFGSRTRAAISAFEQAEGLPVTGAPSATVLDRITTASLVPAPVETVAVDVPSVPDDGAEEAAALLSYPPRQDAAPAAAPPTEPAPPPTAARSADPEPAVVTEASASPTSTAPLAVPAGDLGARRTLSVQKALNQIGYGPVPENGIAGEATITAIRRFELDNGLPITGAAGDTLIERLVAIGAMEAA